MVQPYVSEIFVVIGSRYVVREISQAPLASQSFLLAATLFRESTAVPGATGFKITSRPFLPVHCIELHVIVTLRVVVMEIPLEAGSSWPLKLAATLVKVTRPFDEIERHSEWL